MCSCEEGRRQEGRELRKRVMERERNRERAEGRNDKASVGAREESVYKVNVRLEGEKSLGRTQGFDKRAEVCV